MKGQGAEKWKKKGQGAEFFGQGAKPELKGGKSEGSHPIAN
jgi:hypothetical protein